jgi:hypothetical protein
VEEKMKVEIRNDRERKGKYLPRKEYKANAKINVSI